MRLVKINPSGLSGPEWRVAGWRVSISEVRTMTADNSAQQRALDRLEPLIQVKLTDLQNLVGLRKREGSTAALEAMYVGSAKQLKNRIRALFLEMNQEERRLLVKRFASTEASSQKTKVAIAFVDVLAIVILLAAGFAISREMVQRSRVEREIRRLNENLERRVIDRTDQLQTANVEFQTQIIERERIEHALGDKNVELQNASEAKDQFLANMSHELRTPLNGIIGFAEFLADGKPGGVNPKQKEYLVDISNSGQHLLHLISDILDLIKAGASEMEFSPERFSLCKAIEEACASVKPIAQKKSIHIEVSVTPEIGDVTLDQLKFKRVVSNLLTNAIKFNHDGGKMEIRAEPLYTDRVKLVVSDAGIGRANQQCW